MPRQMRFSGRTLTKNQWLELMEVTFGTLDKSDDDAEYEIGDEIPEFYCEHCDREFNGESQDLVDAPTVCPYCNKAPGAQANTVTYGKRGQKSVVTFPFFAPRPAEQPEETTASDPK